LGQIADAGINDVFLIGGDAAEVRGPYCSAHALLPTVHHHVSRPRAIGIGAYPEGHPLIDPLVLRRALFEKSEMADYIVTQLCFDPRVLTAWIAEMRNDGLTLPMYLGLPGAVDRRRLLEVSMRVGVGASVSFVRKQRGLRRLLGSPAHAADRLHGILAPKVGDSELGLAGLHWYTFNKLRATMALERQPRPGTDTRAVTTSD
jgi:methylenetetrahydrofolate reductase (NADPH)